MYSYNEAYNASLEYFNNDELAAKVFLDKYALRDNDNNILEKTPDDMHRRLAKELARIEQNKFKNPLSFEEIYDLLKGYKRIVLQGSPMFGIGNPYQYVTLSNCYVLNPPDDNYASILSTDHELVQISKRRGGVGIDLSNLRPAGSIVHNAAKSSTGVVSFMERYSNSIREVGQNNRRGALMETISVHHPQVLDFIKAKIDKTKVTGANISVRLTDEFLEAVLNNTEYEQRFPVDAKNIPDISKMVSARQVWNEIVHTAWLTAEPGLVFWDNILRESPADCYKKFGFETVCLNPCAELPLCILDSCRLALINLLTYVINPYTKKAYFDFDTFFQDAKILQRFMDNIIDLELESIQRIIQKIKNSDDKEEFKNQELSIWQKIYDKCYQGRRTGSGITALGDTIAALGIGYGTEKSIKVTEEIYKKLKLACYTSSVEMAQELGAFPIWDSNLEKNNPFILRIRQEDSNLYELMQKYGRRNIALLTTAPAGTVSTQTQTTSGIEPIFNILPYIRKKKITEDLANARVDSIDQNGDKWQHFEVYHPQVLKWMQYTQKKDIKESPWYGYCANDIDWINRVKLQSVAQRHVDHAISSTINLPADITEDVVAKIYETAWKSGCKGITVYREGCRTGVLVNKINNQNTKRPVELKCDFQCITIKGQPFYVAVGLRDGTPYEVFAYARTNGNKIKNQSGIIKKISRKNYQCILDDGTIIEKINDIEDGNQETITRLISTGLRHGIPIEYLVHQLEKTPGDLQSFSKAISRVLKKYIKDGTIIKGEECVECGGQLIREEGCVICKTCGWSKC